MAIIQKVQSNISAPQYFDFVPVSLSTAQVQAILDVLAASNPSAPCVAFDSTTNTFYTGVVKSVSLGGGAGD